MPDLIVRFDTFVLDEGNAALTRDGIPVELPPKAFDVLCELARRPGRLVGKEALLDAVWGHRHISESVLKTTIGQIRAALSDDARAPRLIETVARRGYRFLPPLTPIQAGSAVTAGSASIGPALPPSPQPASRPASPSATNRSSSVRLDAPPPGLVGRRDALDTLATAWRDALAGRRRTVWISGEAGIGKTTLIDGFTAMLGPQAPVVLGQCVEQIGAGEPYAPILDALGMLCRDDPTLPALMRTVAPTWLLQLPWLTDGDERAALQRELAGSTQGRMLRELAELLERHTATRPLLLVTEDLHWSDHATIQLLDYLARRRQPARLMWLASCRPADAIATGHPFSRLRHELRLHGLGTEIALEPFSEREVAAYLAGRLYGRTPPEPFVRRLHAHTDGLPLFVAATTGELLTAQQRHDAGAGPAASPSGAPPADAFPTDASPADASPADAFPADDWSGLTLAAAPASLAGVIDRAIDRLPADRITMLAIASLIGVEFRIRTVADATGHDVATVRAAIDELVRRQQWLEERPLARLADGAIDEVCGFRHSFYRQVFHHRVGPADRIDAHRRILDSLTTSRAAGAPISSAELAAHAEAALMPRAAIGHLTDAAESALAHLAPIEAIRHADAGLALLPQLSSDATSQRDECELVLLVHRGTAHGLLEGIGAPEARSSFERASTLCDRLPPTVPRAWFYSGIGWVHYATGDYPRALAHAGRIADIAATTGDPVLRVCAANLAGVTAIFEGRLADGIAALEGGLAAARDLSDALAAAPFVIEPTVSMHGNVALGHMLAGDVQAARDHLHAAEARGRAIGHPFSTMVALWSRCALHVECQDDESLARDHRLLDALVTHHQIGHGHGPVHWFGASLMAGHGDRGAPARLAQGLACHANLGMDAGNTAVHHYGARIALRLDDPQAAIDQADAGLALARRIGEWAFVPQLLIVKAQALGRLGRSRADRDAPFAEAIAHARQIGSRWGELLARDARQADPGLATANAAEDRAALTALLPRIRGADDTTLVRRTRAWLLRTA